MTRSWTTRARTVLLAAFVPALFWLLPARVAARQAPQAWFGISLECSNCRLIEAARRATGERGAAQPAIGDRWVFTSAPRILAVEAGSPAARAGLQPGDRLTHIDGVALTTDAGTRRMAAVAPGQRVEWTLERAGEVQRTGMVAEPRPAVAPVTTAGQPAGRPAEPEAAPVRFTGAFAGTIITVRGPATTVVLIAERECWLEIRTLDSSVRVAAPGMCDAARAAATTAPATTR